MKHLLLAVWFCLIITNANAQKDESDIDQVASVLAMQAVSWNKGDIEGYMQGYWNSDSLLFIGSNGPVYGYKPTLERYKKSYPDKQAMGVLTFSQINFKLLSQEYYFVSGRWSLQRKNDAPGGYFTLLFRKIGGKWLIVADHSS